MTERSRARQSPRAAGTLTRRVRLLVELSRHARGLRTERLAELLNASRATIDRDLEFLRTQVGVAIEKRLSAGERLHYLRDDAFLKIAVTPVQAAALRLAIRTLRPMQGGLLHTALESFVARLPTPAAYGRDPVAVGQSGATSASESVVATLEQGLADGRRVRVRARIATRGGDVQAYTLDPLFFRMISDDLYLLAWAVERDAPRTFKVARILEAELTSHPVDVHDEIDVEQFFRGAVKAWSGALVDVAIRIDRSVAWSIGEYPLVPDQTLEVASDGSVIVRARTAGLLEPTRWALSWGRNATALSPPDLVQALCREHGDALARYRADEVRSRV